MISKHIIYCDNCGREIVYESCECGHVNGNPITDDIFNVTVGSDTEE